MTSNVFENIKSKLIYDDVNKNLLALKEAECRSQYNCDEICTEIALTHKASCAGDNLMKDIEMFVDFSGNTNINTVFCTFETFLSGSKPLLKLLLNTPIADINILKKRIAVNTMLEMHVGEGLNTKFARLKELEHDVAWIFLEKDENLKELFDIVYFKWLLLERLNNSPMALTSTIFYKIALSPLVGILSPVVYFIIPYLVLRYKFGFKDISFWSYLRITYTSLMTTDLFAISNHSLLKWVNIISQVMSLLFYFQGVFNSIELAKTFHKVSKHITTKMNSVAEFINISNDIFDKVSLTEINELYFTYTELGSKMNLGFDPKPFSLLSNFGKQLTAFKNINIEHLKKLVHKVYIMDTLYSIASYKKKNNASYPTFIDQDIPVVTVDGLWHPCINLQKAIKNDIHVHGHNNAIITGPNAGGKSTFIKSLLINIVFAQTIGISCSSNLSLTPLHTIHSQINLPDNKGQESLFEAEMYRCKSVLDMLRSSPSNRTIIVMDEIFNSTNPVEGIAGAFAILKKISEYRNAILVFTTHYAYLTKLSKATERFVNYRMNIIKDEDKIVYPYKLDKGISKQYIALELLSLNGFDPEIIKEALELKEKFVSK